MPNHTMHPNRLRSHDAVIRVYDATGDVIETHEHALSLKNVGANRQSKLIGAPQADLRSKGLRPNVAVRASSSSVKVEDASGTDPETTAMSIG
jgi:hypothetical protein